MDRGQQGGDRRRREDTRDHKPRYDRERERSRSPARRERRDDYHRERSPPRGPGRGPPGRSDRDRDYHRPRDREQSGTPPPPRRPGDRPPPRQPLDDRGNNAASRKEPAIKQEAMPALQDEEGHVIEEAVQVLDAAMQRAMGFQGFKTTKETKVPGNDKNYGVSKAKKTEYRQYMNRVGGFNRPLSPSRM